MTHAISRSFTCVFTLLAAFSIASCQRSSAGEPERAQQGVDVAAAVSGLHFSNLCTSAGEAECTTDADCGGSVGDAGCGTGVCHNRHCWVCPQDAGFICQEALHACEVPAQCDGRTTVCPSLPMNGGSAVLKSKGTLCRAPAPGDTCDAPEYCDGMTGTCPVNQFYDSAHTCRPAAGPCDKAEQCDGHATCPRDVFAGVGDNITCYEAQGVCDHDVKCPGGTPACPAGHFYDGTHICRAGGKLPEGGDDACDPPEACPGNSIDCPAEIVVPSHTTCRAKIPSDACDVDETCGGATQCPPDGFAGTDTRCARGDASTCTGDTYCPGNSRECPSTPPPAQFNLVCNQAALDTYGCGATGGRCDGANLGCPSVSPGSPGEGCVNGCAIGRCVADHGSHLTCLHQVSDGVLDAGVKCHSKPAGADCDTDQFCDGMRTDCPSSLLPSTHECRASAGDCDVAEVCDGGQYCPHDVLKPSSHICDSAPRASDGTTCANDAYCTGADAGCPSITLKDAGTPCRAADVSNVCDVPEVCNGTMACPADAPPVQGADAGTKLCNPPRGPCDVAEFCGGASNACPIDGVADATTICNPSAGFCDPADHCSGPPVGDTSANAINIAKLCPRTANVDAGVVCGDAGPSASCHPAPTCDGNGSCIETVQPSGAQCEDSNLCDGINRCDDTGDCVAPAVTDWLAYCDDGNPCTTESCSSTGGCQHSLVVDGVSCDSYCFTGSVCQAGACVRGTPRDCAATLGASGGGDAGVDGGTYDAGACNALSCQDQADGGGICYVAPSASGIGACADNLVKPEFLIILDNSGSMTAATSNDIHAHNTCDFEHTRMSDAKCVLQHVVGTFGEAQFGLETYATSVHGTYNAGAGCTCSGSSGRGTCPASCDNTSCAFDTANDCANCDAGTGVGCLPETANADAGVILTPIYTGSENAILKWTDFSQNECAFNTGAPSDDPELTANPANFTPIAGALRTAKRYYEGRDPHYPGASPVDPGHLCRPYYVVLITDGDEDCSQFDGDAGTLAAADELHDASITVSGGPDYHFGVDTIVIQMSALEADGGIAPASAQARQLASHGSVDGRGAPFVAWDEASLATSFSQIVQNSVLVEKCNCMDDNCNGFTDESTPGQFLYSNLTAGCHVGVGACERVGSIQCNAAGNGTACVDAAQGFETCGAPLLVPGAPGTEICNGIDDDCNGVVDDVRDSTGHIMANFCGVCENTPEICDGVDNNCNGLVDEGVTRGCGFELGACHAGIQVCTGEAGGRWGACTGVLPTTESCNGIDDNCDGIVDNVAMGSTTDNTTWGTACGDGGIDLGDASFCASSSWQCVDRAAQCVQAGVLVAAAPEVCDCRDNNCNGTTDGPSELVGCGTGGSACLPFPFCQCAKPCGNGADIQCRLGEFCATPTGSSQSFCVTDPCTRTDAPRCDMVGGQKQICQPNNDGTASCVNYCSTISCGTGYVCRPSDGACILSCDGGPCTEVTCGDMTCPVGASCSNGTCVAHGADAGIADGGIDGAVRVVAQGGGLGCSAAPARHGSSFLLSWLMFAFGVLLTRVRARNGGAQ